MDKESSVFGPYWNGAVTVYGDPLELHRALLRAAGGRLDRLLQDAQAEGPEDGPGDDPDTLARKAEERAIADARSLPALDRLANMARDAFGMVAFDRTTGTGATLADCHRVLCDFFAFLNGEKKSTEHSPICVPPTVPASSAAP